MNEETPTFQTLTDEIRYHIQKAQGKEVPPSCPPNENKEEKGNASDTRRPIVMDGGRITELATQSEVQLIRIEINKLQREMVEIGDSVRGLAKIVNNLGE